MHMKLALAMHTTTLTRPMMQPKPSVACRRLSVCAAQGAPAPHPAAGGSRASQLFKAHRKLMQVGFTYEQARVILQITDSRAPQAAPMATLAPPLPAPVAPQQLPPLTQPLDQEQAATAAAAAAASDSRTTLLERRLQALEAGPLAQQLLGGPPADTSGAAAAPSGAGDGAAAAVSTSGAASMVIALLQRLQELEARLDAVELEAIRLAVAKQPLESISLEAFHVGAGCSREGPRSCGGAELGAHGRRQGENGETHVCLCSMQLLPGQAGRGLPSTMRLRLTLTCMSTCVFAGW